MTNQHPQKMKAVHDLPSATPWWALPWLPALAYLAAIPLFAFGYASLPNEFFHSTVSHERYLQIDERHILDALRAAMEPHPNVNAAPEKPAPDILWKNVRLF